MLQEILALTKVLMMVPSIKDDSESLELALEIAGQELYDFPVKQFEKNDIPSFLYANKPFTDLHFKIILNTNLDVVEADKSLFRPYEKQGKLYGRGAYAMKAPAAAMILAFKNVANQVDYPLALQLVTDEETGGENGTKYQIGQGVRGDFALTSASTNFSLSNEAKGILWIKITAKGQTAHTAYPWKGKNALGVMTKFLTTLEENFPTPKDDEWITTVTVSNIKTTNNTFNNIPNSCEAWLDVRYIASEKPTILDKIRHLLPKDFSMEVVIQDNPEYTSKDNPFIQQLSTSFKHVTGELPPIIKKNFTDEVRHFNNVGCPGVGFSPKGGDSHTDNEWVDIQSLADYYYILKDFLLSINSD